MPRGLLSAAAALVALGTGHLGGVTPRPEAKAMHRPSYTRNSYGSRVYPGGSIPGGLRRRRQRNLGGATYTGPLWAYYDDFPTCQEPLRGKRCIVKAGSRAGTVRAQFNDKALALAVRTTNGGKMVQLAYDWHEFPRNHFRFDPPVRWD